MGNLMAKKEKPLKDIIKENQRMIKKSIRDLEKEIRALEASEKKLANDIRKSAKANQMGVIKIMAKDMIRTRNYITKFIEMKTHLTAVGLKLQTVKSHHAMSEAMKGVTQSLKVMNKQMNLPQLQKIMAEFMKENELAEIMQETMGDAIDDAMETEDSAEEEDMIVRQVLDELGLSVGDNVAAAPSGNIAAAQNNGSAVVETQAPDPQLSELEERLNNLRK